MGLGYREHNGEYKFPVDATDKVEGKYSLAIQSDTIHKDSSLSSASITFYLEGDYLKNKEVEVVAYVKTNMMANGFMDLFCSHAPDKMTAYPFLYLKGIHPWQSYRGISYTDSMTDEIAFGAAVHGKGAVHLDHFAVYINGQLVDASFMRKTGLVVRDSTEADRLNFLHLTEVQHSVTGVFHHQAKSSKEQNKIPRNNIELAGKKTPFENLWSDSLPDKMRDSSEEALNFGFEKLNDDNLPADVKW